jgi:GNAT superfamily N-acetyltransferase
MPVRDYDPADLERCRALWTEMAERHRGLGSARKLLDHVILRARDVVVLCLSVKPVARNEEAISFFHAAGFNILGPIQMFMWLGPTSPGQWKTGPEIFGKPFDY